jgi:hypothetical protein
METIRSSETSVGSHRTTRFYIPEHRTLYNRHFEDLKSRLLRFIWPSYKLPALKHEAGENLIMRMIVYVARMGDLRISFAGCFTTLLVARLYNVEL